MATGRSKKFKGSVCKTDCSGHRAGYRYGMRGGTLPAKRSSSFNAGLKAAIRQRKRRK